MNDTIKVHVVDYGRKSLYMRYRDPMTGKQQTRSTGTKRRKEAERIAAKWEHDLREGRYKSPSKVTWDEFRQRYEDEVVASLSDGTDAKIAATFNAAEQYINPDKLGKLTAERISYLQSRLRDDRKLAESTIKGHMAHLQAALNWANRIGMLTAVPKIDMPRRAKRSKLMKGRPITLEEFERMLKKTPHVVGESAADSWRYFLRGLWWSGLRLGEALDLYWDRDDKLCIDQSGKHVMLRIPAELEKGHKDRLLPISPEFVEFLMATPVADRTGPVFNPIPKRVKGPRLQVHRVGELISLIGKEAGVKVHTEPKSGKVKFASAHDLRRSFGERWAMRVMPHVLQQLMRHESIETTMKYYVGRNAESTADALWNAISGNTSGNSAAESSSAKNKTPPQVIDATGLSM